MSSDKDKQPAEPCSECDQIRIGKALDAEESARAFGRDLEKLESQQKLDIGKLAEQQGIDLAKLEREHEIELDTAEDAAVTELQKARWETEFGLAKLFHEKLGEVAGGAIERARDSAKYIQTVAAWIATLYGSLLALVFSVTDNPLPVRGVFSALFLGLAVALATGYLAFVTRPPTIPFYEGGGSLTEQQMNRTGYLINWINATVLDRRWAIRASVVSLALGVAFIPAAFVTRSQTVSVPEAPTAPAIPAAIAAQIGNPAAELFKEQVSSYKSAVIKNNEASKQASQAAIDTPDREAALNDLMLVLAGIGLLLVIFFPIAYGRVRDKPPAPAAAP